MSNMFGRNEHGFTQEDQRCTSQPIRKEQSVILYSVHYTHAVAIYLCLVLYAWNPQPRKDQIKGKSRPEDPSNRSARAQSGDRGHLG